MAKLSSPVADGQVAQASQYNNLLHDLLYEHAHSGPGDGPPVEHGGCVDGDITDPANTYHTHLNLKVHMIGATGTEFVDDPGGKAGVHGLPDWADVMGSRNGQLVIQMGQANTDASTTQGDYEIQTLTTAISFGDAFENVANNPKIFITVLDPMPAAVAIDSANYSNAGFKPLIWFPFPDSKSKAQYAASFLWVAIGTLPA